MKIMAECKQDIVSNKGDILFGRHTIYKGTFHEGKANMYIIKDETGCLQSLPDDKFFKAHFKVIQDGME